MLYFSGWERKELKIGSAVFLTQAFNDIDVIPYFFKAGWSKFFILN